jgi:hypothetical protein
LPTESSGPEIMMVCLKLLEKRHMINKESMKGKSAARNGFDFNFDV